MIPAFEAKPVRHGGIRPRIRLRKLPAEFCPNQPEHCMASASGRSASAPLCATNLATVLAAAASPGDNHNANDD